jgi:phage N-6-adenine-methyltransferase
MSMAVHYSSSTPEWPTPQLFYDELNFEFGFTLDACAQPWSAKCERYCTTQHGFDYSILWPGTAILDGLSQDWTGEVAFMNPPYGREIKHWIKKARDESAKFRGATVVALVPARTDTAWWHDYVIHYEVRFVRGRLKFGDGKNPAPFPSAVVIFKS